MDGGDMSKSVVALSGAVLAIGCFTGSTSAQLTISGEIRDFRGSFNSASPYVATAGGHPHFEIYTFNSFSDNRIPAGFNPFPFGQTSAVEPGIVGTTLDAGRN